MIVTVAQRRQMAIERMRLASSAVIGNLREFSAKKGGRFVVFGSFARGDIGPTSDFDVMVDFPTVLERDARISPNAFADERGSCLTHIWCPTP